MRLIASDLALKEVVALAAGGEMSLAQLSRAVKASPSAGQRALDVLLDDGIVQRHADRPAYRLGEDELASHVLSLALLEMPLELVVSIAGRATPAIEFAAEDIGTLIVVFSSRQPALLISRAAAFLEKLANRHSLDLRCMDHRDVRRELLPRPELRDELAQARILHGELDRSFPDRSRHAVETGHLLGRPHPALRFPPRRQLRNLARRHGLKSLRLFGSSVRSDFRPDSDVDVLVGFRPGIKPTLASLVELANQLEDVLDRDVDVVREESLGPELRNRVVAEAVPLL